MRSKVWGARPCPDGRFQWFVAQCVNVLSTIIAMLPIEKLDKIAWLSLAWCIVGSLLISACCVAKRSQQMLIKKKKKKKKKKTDADPTPRVRSHRHPRACQKAAVVVLCVASVVQRVRDGVSISRKRFRLMRSLTGTRTASTKRRGWVATRSRRTDIPCATGCSWHNSATDWPRSFHPKGLRSLAHAASSSITTLHPTWPRKCTAPRGLCRVQS